MSEVFETSREIRQMIGEEKYDFGGHPLLLVLWTIALQLARIADHLHPPVDPADYRPKP